MEFQKYPKTPRLEKEVIITEKIDGTNAQIHVVELAEQQPPRELLVAEFPLRGLGILAGSRNRYITPEDDNFGFATWVRENAEELVKLGPGRHYGEWWGQGIQRGYGLPEKRFSLFNVHRWGMDPCGIPANPDCPSCCYVVPYLGAWSGYHLNDITAAALNRLTSHGSQAAPSFDKPEGVVVYHTGANQCFKAYCEGEG